MHVVVLNDMSSARGGATGMALLSIALMRAKGLKVTLICGDLGESAELEALGVEVVALGQRALNTGGLKSAFSGLYNAGAAHLVSDWLKRYDHPEVIYHLHGWAQILSPSIFSPLSKVSKRLFIHAHDYFLACPNGAFFDFRRSVDCILTPLSVQCLSLNCDKRKYSHKLWRFARHFILKYQSDISNASVLVIHEKMREGLVRAGLPSEILTPFRNPVTPYRTDRVHAERNRRVVYIGRLAIEKGVDDAVQATAAAGLELWVAGDGPLRNSPALSSRHVKQFGWCNAAELGEIVKDARLVTMPSRVSEPFGLVCLEALGSGVPVILPPNASLAEDVQKWNVGFVCDTSNINEFTQTIKAAMANDQDIENKSKNGKNCLRFIAPSKDEWIDKLIQLYSERLGLASSIM